MGRTDNRWPRHWQKQEELNKKSFIRLLSLRETLVTVDTGVVTCPTFNQQTINVTRQLSCHRREHFIDYNSHQCRNGITIPSVDGVIFSSAPKHKVRSSVYKIISARDEKRHCPTKVREGFRMNLILKVSNDNSGKEMYDLLGFYAA
jgi:hypothetical protein